MRTFLTSAALPALLGGALAAAAQNPPAQTPDPGLEAARGRAEEAQREVDAINREARELGEGPNIPQSIENVSTRLSESEEQARRMRDSIERLGGTAEELDKVRKEMDEAWIFKKTDAGEESLKYLGEGFVGWLLLSEIGKKATGIIGIAINVLEYGARKVIKEINVSEMEKLVKQEQLTMKEVYKLSIAVHAQADADRKTLGTLKDLQARERAAWGRLAEANQGVRQAEERANLLKEPATKGADLKRTQDAAGDYKLKLEGAVRPAERAGYKISENDAPIPRDRIIYNYNYFSDVKPGVVSLELVSRQLANLLGNPSSGTLTADQVKRIVTYRNGDALVIAQALDGRLKISSNIAFDAAGNPVSVNNGLFDVVSAQQAAVDGAMQKMGTSGDAQEDDPENVGEIEPKTVISHGTEPRVLPLSARSLWRAFLPARTASLNHGFWVAPAAASPPQPGASAPPLLMTFTSLGVSTGEAFEVQIVNNTPRPVLIDNWSLVLEPLAKDAARKIQQEMLKLGAGRIRKLKLNAYCLEHLRLPPTAGTMFRLAPADQQARLAPTRRIFQASRRLLREGALKPDSEPKAYFHSIRQWAIWTAEQGFDQKRFENAFVEHARKNLVAGGRKWSDEFDKALRGAVPHRWQQVNLVLQAARAAQSGDR